MQYSGNNSVVDPGYLEWCINLLFCNIFAENSVKRKQFGLGASLAPPIGSATGNFKDFALFVLPYFANTGFRYRKGLTFIDIVSGDSKLPNQMFFFYFEMYYLQY